MAVVVHLIGLAAIAVVHLIAVAGVVVSVVGVVV